MHSQPRGLARELEQFALVVVRVDQIVSRIAELSAPSHPFSPCFFPKASPGRRARQFLHYGA